MPEIDAPHLIDYLFEAGPTLISSMGEGPLTHSELHAWQRNTGITLQPWEARIMIRLSKDYLGEAQRAKARDAEAPWIDDDYQRRHRERLLDRIKSGFAT